MDLTVVIYIIFFIPIIASIIGFIRAVDFIQKTKRKSPSYKKPANLVLFTDAIEVVACDLIENAWLKRKNEVAIIPTFTTRAPKECERKLSSCVNFVSRKKFNRFRHSSNFYCYEYGQDLYGVHKEDVRKAVYQAKQVFMIAFSDEIILDVCKDFSDIAEIQHYFFQTCESYATERLIRFGADEELMLDKMNKLKLMIDRINKLQESKGYLIQNTEYMSLYDLFVVEVTKRTYPLLRAAILGIGGVVSTSIAKVLVKKV